MNYHQSRFNANKTIDLIMTKGAEHLYNRYLINKIPNHTNEESNNMIQYCFDSGYTEQPKTTQLKKIDKPAASRLDYLTPGKISQQKYYPIHTFHNKGGKKKQSQLVNISYKRNEQKKTEICFKLTQNNFDDNQMKLRKQKRKQQRQKSSQIEEVKMNQEKNMERKQKLIQRMNDLKKKKIPCCFDDEGNIIIPNVKEFRNRHLKKRINENKVLALNYQTIEFKTKSLFKSVQQSLSGRKRGFSSPQKHKKAQNITEDDFTNNDQRQQSTIPFLRLNEGIKLVETERNVVASRSKETENTRSTYLQENNKGFKSYMPDVGEEISSLSMQTFNGKRPSTTENFNRTYQTVRQNTKKSILWRPTHTSQSKRHRLNVKNVQLIKQIVEV